MHYSACLFTFTYMYYSVFICLLFLNRHTSRNISVWNSILDDWFIISFRIGSHSAYLFTCLLQITSKVCALLLRNQISSFSKNFCLSLFYFTHLYLFGNCGVCSGLGFSSSDGNEYGFEHWDHFSCLYFLYCSWWDQSCHLDQCLPGILYDHSMFGCGYYRYV